MARRPSAACLDWQTRHVTSWFVRLGAGVGAAALCVAQWSSKPTVSQVVAAAVAAGVAAATVKVKKTRGPHSRSKKPVWVLITNVTKDLAGVRLLKKRTWSTLISWLITVDLRGMTTRRSVGHFKKTRSSALKMSYVH